jgi:hypothetical protein
LWPIPGRDAKKNWQTSANKTVYRRRCPATAPRTNIAARRSCSENRFFQEILARQLEDILLALEADLDIRLAPTIGEGTRVKIKHGPLRGIEGWVEKRHGMNIVLLRLDFIGQAAAVKMEATDLEPI